MKIFLIASLIAIFLVSYFIFNHEVSALISYNQNPPVITWNTHTRGAFETFVSSANDGKISQWFSGSTDDYVLWYQGGIQPTIPSSGPIELDNVQNKQFSGSTNATQFVSLTVANNPNRTLVATVSWIQDSNHNHIMSSVKLGSLSFTRVLNGTTDNSDSEIWYLTDPPTGATHITFTPVTTASYYGVVGVYSLFNTLTTSPIGSTAYNTTTNVRLNAATNHSWIVDSQAGYGTGGEVLTGLSDVVAFKYDGVPSGGSQYRQVPQFGVNNKMSWSSSASSNVPITAIEVKPASTHQKFIYLNGPLKSYSKNVISNGSSLYYPIQALGDNTHYKIDSTDTLTGVITHGFTLNTSCIPTASLYVFKTDHDVLGWCDVAGNEYVSTKNTNNTVFADAGMIISNQKIGGTGTGLFIRANFNDTTARSITANPCELLYLPTNTTTRVQDIGCDISIPTKITRYWDGLGWVKTNNFGTQSLLPFYNSIINDNYKKFLTLPTEISGVPDQSIFFTLTNATGDYIFGETATTIYYLPATTLANIFSQNYATQTYFTIYSNTTSTDMPPGNLINTLQWKLYGPALNVTTSRYGATTLPSGYTMKLSSLENAVRTIDPKWTNDNSVYPSIISSGSLFPIVLTINNAPTVAALKVTNGGLIVNGIESIWSVVELDSTHTAQFDIPAGQCANIYVADSSVSPVVYLFQGSICASGINAKTIGYTNTLPLTFFTLKYGATDSYTPATNALSTTVRSTATPFTYNVIVKNSTGTVAINSTFTTNSTMDTRNFNVSSVTKPAGLFISIAGVGQIYSSYLGSPLSLASAASFFHQYFNYQGFDFLSFIPIIFSSMFTRNTVGIGASLTVVCIATLSWLSIVVVSDTIIFISMIIAVISLIGYRSLYG